MSCELCGIESAVTEIEYNNCNYKACKHCELLAELYEDEEDCYV